MFLRLTAFSVLTLLMACPAQAASSVQPDFESRILGTALSSCVTPLTVGADVIETAQQLKLIELSPEKALLFDKTGHKVFADPDLPFVVLTTGVPSGCGILAMKVDPILLWRAVDDVFGPATPFKLKEDKTLPDGLSRAYEAEINDRHIAAFISVRHQFQPGAIQMLITVARIQ